MWVECRGPPAPTVPVDAVGYLGLGFRVVCCVVKGTTRFGSGWGGCPV